jgi:hypothetical protein
MAITPCPRCGAKVFPTASCPLCQESLKRMNLQRAILWAVVMGELLLMGGLQLAE